MLLEDPADLEEDKLVLPTPRWALPLHAETTPSGQIVRYRGAHGGRGGGKSQEFAGMVVEAMVIDPHCSVVCIREVQKSLKFSVKKLVEEKIREFGVSHLFEIKTDEIRRRGGTGVCLFQGMQDHTADSIKSLQGFKIAWVEEAQSLSARSLTLLRPTIRDEGSEIWFSWNPGNKFAPVELLLRNPRGRRDDAIVVEVNYVDNPFLPQTLRREAETDQIISPDTYDHVWMGGFESDASKVVIPDVWIEAAVGLVQDYDLKLGSYIGTGLDVAGGQDGGDENAMSFRQDFELFHIEKWNGLDTGQTTDRACELGPKYGAEECYYDAASIGEGVTAAWAAKGRNNKRPKNFMMIPWMGGMPVLNPDDKVEPNNERSPLNKHQYHNLKAQGWMDLRKRFENAFKMRKGLDYDPTHLISLHPDLPFLLQIQQELSQPHHKESGTGKVLVDKAPDGSKSPNMGDCIMQNYFPIPFVTPAAQMFLTSRVRNR